MHHVMKFQEKDLSMTKDEFYMSKALEEAKKAKSLDEVPVGCIIVINDEIVSVSHNLRRQDHLVTSHAEINAIIDYEKRINQLILDDATLYVTLEPCPMCAFAIMEAHIKRVCFGCKDPKRGAISNLDMFNKKMGSKVEVCGNILEEDCSNLLKEFFKQKR